MPRPVYVYWCETDDHDEDWFVVARSPRQAACFFEEYEGYDPGDCTATRIARVPPGVELRSVPGWARDSALLAAGGEFVPYTPPSGEVNARLRDMLMVVTKAVRFGDRVYVAGDIVANQAAREGLSIKN